MIKIVFIAAPYRDDRGIWYVTENIRRAKQLAELVWRWGGVAICPHLNSALMDGLHGCDDNTWLAGYKEVLKRCDAVMVGADYHSSQGTLMEIDLAQSLEIPVFFKITELEKFLEEE